MNPTDVVTPFTYNQLDTEDRIGVDAVRVRIPIGAMGEWDTGYIFGEGFDSEKSALFLRSQLNAVETDFSILLVGFQKHLLAGLDIARGIGGAGFWLEAAYVFVESFGQDSDTANNYLRVSTGLDYSFGEKTYGFIEYHFNGVGREGSRELPRQFKPASLHPRGRLPNGYPLSCPRILLSTNPSNFLKCSDVVQPIRFVNLVWTSS